MKKTLSVVLSLVMGICLVACQNNNATEKTTENNRQSAQETLWTDATYTEDTEIGEGRHTVAVKITAEGKTVTVTLHTDRTILGQALKDSNLIQGSDSEYGIFISHVNGMKAVYEEDNAYWAFLDGEGNYMNNGVDGTELTGNDSFCFVHTAA